MSEIHYSDFGKLLHRLNDHGVEFLVVGGVAAAAHGSPRATFDVDVLYHRTAENRDRILAAFANLQPYPRGAPPNLPFSFDRRTFDLGLNFTLLTTLGAVDLLGEIAGGTYQTLLPESAEMTIFGVVCRCLTLDTLIRTKRAAGRPKDFEALAELDSIRLRNERLKNQDQFENPKQS